MRISIVVPVYNVEKYLKQCVESLLEQTIAPYEIILVDDGSTDGSGAICDAFAAEHETVFVVRQKNAGLGMARNAGLERVTGDYVIFVDSDDFCQKDMVEKMQEVVEETDCDTCKTSFNRVDLECRFLNAETIEPGTFRGQEVRAMVLPRLIGSAPDKKDSVPPSACCTMYSMAVIRENGLRFVSEREWISEDIIFNIQYFSLAENVVLSSYIGYNYRVNPHSLSTKYMPDRLERCVAMYHKEVELLQEKGLYELCRYRLMRQFFIYLQMCFSQLKASGLAPGEQRREISRICSDPLVRQIAGGYPAGKLGLQQRAFVYLLRLRAAWALRMYFCR